ncbi:hypothetical protein P5G51_008185 [Virgibacillus sp. 179-BFC.A HS]|uniref:Uncharacterized protein n=1 Tax=Tigheibacillus jepli TaxID=3035914 RepID=A0ABU5CGC9_9BACI|nr:hypothetical protein [Virgibacillus sp. 179-BFC.A HS]MDY0405379.1 hypothetical protein [Virgibacillus sp. 179-BFC.A HS]
MQIFNFKKDTGKDVHQYGSTFVLTDRRIRHCKLVVYIWNPATELNIIMRLPAADVNHGWRGSGKRM